MGMLMRKMGTRRQTVRRKKKRRSGEKEEVEEGEGEEEDGDEDGETEAAEEDEDIDAGKQKAEEDGHRARKEKLRSWLFRDLVTLHFRFHILTVVAFQQRSRPQGTEWAVPPPTAVTSHHTTNATVGICQRVGGEGPKLPRPSFVFLKSILKEKLAFFIHILEFCIYCSRSAIFNDNR